jgi:hypothetical protein
MTHNCAISKKKKEKKNKSYFSKTDQGHGKQQQQF